MRTGIILILAAISVAGCAHGVAVAPEYASVLNPAASGSFGDDAEMRAAQLMARDSLNEFLSRMSGASRGGNWRSIKVRIRANGQTREVWLKDVTYDGAVFSGKTDVALTAPAFAASETISVGPGDICDWVIISNGALIGGYTVQVMRQRMTEEERDAFDLALRIRGDAN